MEGSKKKYIDIKITSKNNLIHIIYKDTGCGIAPINRDSIFSQEFSTKRSEKGGFGLFYAKTVLEKYGGSIKLKESKIGKGTVFVVSLRMV